MANPNVIELTDDSFESEVIKSDLPVFIDFWAVWCGPCRQVAPSVDRLADTFAGQLKVAKLDIDRNQLVPQQYGIRSIPTMLVVKGGRVVGTIVGAMPYSRIESEVKKHL
ncbi:MAG: thioredoxin [bacterium]|nr:thioredoxin [Myxococcales bacterium]